MLVLKLPFPPSVNSYWRHVVIGGRARAILSSKARDYKKAVAARVTPPAPRINRPVAAHVTLHPPDKRKRDLDNFQKALFDAITGAGIWEDDSLVHDLRLVWGPVIAGGMAVVKIEILVV